MSQLRSWIFVGFILGIPGGMLVFTLGGLEQTIFIYVLLSLCLSVVSFPSLLRAAYVHVGVKLWLVLWLWLAVTLLLGFFLEKDIQLVTQFGELVGVVAWLNMGFLALPALRRPQEWFRALAGLRFLGIFVSASVLITLISYIIGPFTLGEAILEQTRSRYFGFWGDGTGWVVLFFLIWSIARGSLPEIALHGIALSLAAIRGTFIALAIGTFLVLLHQFLMSKNYRGKIRPLRIAGSLVVIIVLMAAGLRFGVFDTVMDRFQDTSDFMESRGFNLLAGIEVFKSSPVIGIGFGQFPRIDPVFASSFNITPNYFEAPAVYSTLIDVGVASGLPGVLLLGAAVFLMVIRRPHGNRVLGDRGDKFFLAVEWYAFAMVFGNHFANWNLTFSFSGFLLSLLLGIHLAGIDIASKQTSSVPSASARNPG